MMKWIKDLLSNKDIAFGFLLGTISSNIIWISMKFIAENF